jgi:CysZ protein
MSAPESSVARGLRLAARGLRLALGSAEVRRTYLRLAAVLVLLSLVLSFALAGVAWYFIPVTGDMSWWTWLGSWLLRLGGVALAFLAAPLLSLFICNVGLPFLADSVFMAGVRAVDPALAARLDKGEGVGFFAGVGDSVRRLLYFLGVTALVIAVSLVPVAGAVVGTVLQLWFAARTLCWELLDPYFERTGRGYGVQRELIRTRRATMAGFGLAWTVLMAVPVVGPLLFGLAQAAVAALVVEDFEAAA